MIDRYSEEYQKEVITKDELSQIPHDHVTMGLLEITNGMDLFKAEVNNNYNIILDILNRNPHIVHERDRYKGKSLLHYAVLLGAIRVTEYLLQMGADVNSKDDDGVTPLIITCGLKCKFIIAKLLISKGVDVNYRTPIIPNSPKHGWAPIHIAARNGHIKLVDLLITNGANVNTTKADGWTPLHVAAFFGHIDIVKFLLSKGADINAKANDGSTALIEATEGGKKDIVRILEDWQKNSYSSNSSVGRAITNVQNEKIDIRPRRDWAELVKKLVENAASAAYPGYTGKVNMIGIEPPHGVERHWEGAEAFVCEREEHGNFNGICFRVFVGFHNSKTDKFEFAKHTEVAAGKLIDFFWPPRNDWASTPIIYAYGQHASKVTTP